MEKLNGKEFSGGAIDTLHALFWFGPREAGQIPSKSGEAELAERGYCKRIDVVTSPKGKDTHLCVLTAEGYAFAKLCYAPD